MGLDRFIGRTPPEKEGVNPPVNIEEIRKIRVYYSEIDVIKHRRVYKGKLYEWIEKRITLPPDWPDNELVYCLRERDFHRLIDLLSQLLSTRNKGCKPPGKHVINPSNKSV